MQVSEDTLKIFEGGQVEIQNEHEKFSFRGKINKIFIKADKLVIRFDWLAESKDFPAKKWQYVRTPEVEILIHRLSKPYGIGSGRIALDKESGEKIIFYTKSDTELLDPNEVEGMILESEENLKIKKFQDEIFKLLYPKGSIRLSDDSALLMFPEAQTLSRSEYLALKDEGKILETWRMCDTCRVLMKIEYTEKFNFFNLPACPCCHTINGWVETEARVGITDGHLSAPRVPKEGVQFIKCPGCNTLMDEKDFWGQKMHMERRHPEIIAQRLSETN